jgi:hypothetical protein
MTKIPRPVHDYSAAQVVAIGGGKYGIVWNGQLRPEEYPTKGFAFLAIVALRRQDSAPTAPVDDASISVDGDSALPSA